MKPVSEVEVHDGACKGLSNNESPPEWETILKMLNLLFRFFVLAQDVLKRKETRHIRLVYDAVGACIRLISYSHGLDDTLARKCSQLSRLERVLKTENDVLNPCV